MFRNDDNRKHKNALEKALNGLDVLRDVELVLAPLRPTSEMIEAGCRTAGLTPMQAQLVYEAMVRASVPAFAEDDLL
jgi:hypothetical protein